MVEAFGDSVIGETSELLCLLEFWGSSLVWGDSGGDISYE